MVTAGGSFLVSTFVVRLQPGDNSGADLLGFAAYENRGRLPGRHVHVADRRTRRMMPCPQSKKKWILLEVWIRELAKYDSVSRGHLFLLCSSAHGIPCEEKRGVLMCTCLAFASNPTTLFGH